VTLVAARPNAGAQTADTAADAAYPPQGRAWYAVGVLTVAWMLAYLDRQIISILIEPLRHDLGLSDTQASMIQGLAFSIFFVLAGLPIGRLVDRANRRNILLFGIAAWSVATIACGFATSFWQLFAARTFVGVGEACLAPATVSLLADLVRPQRRGLAMGLTVAGTSLGSAVSTLVGGLVLQAFGPSGHRTLPVIGDIAAWQLVFFIVGSPGVLVALLCTTIREPERRERARQVDGRSFVASVRRSPATYALGYVTYACNMVIGYSTSVWIPVILLRVHKMEPAQVGLIITSSLLFVGTPAAAAGGALGDRIAKLFPRVGRPGVALLVYPVTATLLIGWWFSGEVYFALIAYAFCGPLLGTMINASSYPALTQMAPNEMRGQMIAVYLVVANLAGLGVAPTLVALITDYVLQDPTMVRESVILVAAPAAILGFLCALAWLRPYHSACRATAAAIEGKSEGQL
jgi:MFS family permease